MMELQTLIRELEKVESDIDGGFYDNDPAGLDNAIDHRSRCLNEIEEYDKSLVLSLAIPRNTTMEEAIYWLNLAREYCPGRAIVPKFK